MAGKSLPSPGKDSPEKDPLLEEYYSSLGEDTGESNPGEMRRFDHLLFHSDCEGFYVPVKFSEVIFTDQELEIPGEMIGSSYMLLEECKASAQYLELPLDEDDRIGCVGAYKGTRELINETGKNFLE